MIASLLSKTNLEDALLPSPLPVISQEGWDGTQLASNTYVHHLSASELASINSAINHFEDLQLDLAQIYPETFPLPLELAARLRALSGELHDGIGFGVVRGLIPDDYNERQSIVAFAGIASYIGRQRATDPQGHTLVHVRDATRDARPHLEPNEGMLLPGAKVPDALKFHADRRAGDILALYLKDLGLQGGQQRLASFPKIYQELRQKAPHILSILMKDDWPWESTTSEGEPCVRPGPVMWVANGKPIIQFTYTPLVGSERSRRSDSLPAVSVKQRLAMKMLESTASRVSHILQREPGDILFVNNLSILHARDSYYSGGIVTLAASPGAGSSSSNGATRHLLRLFVRDPHRSWVKPEQLQAELDEVFAPDRVQHLPVHDTDPYLRYHYPAVQKHPGSGNLRPPGPRPKPTGPPPRPSGPKPEQHG